VVIEVVSRNMFEGVKNFSKKNNVTLSICAVILVVSFFSKWIEGWFLSKYLFGMISINFSVKFFAYATILLVVILKRLGFVKICILVFVWMGLLLVPIPGYLDGLSLKIQSRVSEKEFFRFASAVKGADSSSLVDEDFMLNLLSNKFPKIFELSPARPKIFVSDDYVEICWGGGLGKRTCILISASSQKINSSPGPYQYHVRQVHRGVWVVSEK